MEPKKYKICSKCGARKPIEKFYIIPSSGNPMGACKACRRLASKERVSYAKNKAGNEHERQLISILRDRGIYAVTGKSSEFNRVDVVAWGCVRIEVKASTVNETGYYHYGFSSRQRKEGIQADLVCISTQSDYPIALFPSSHPVFYTPSGAVKSAFAWKPRMRNTKSKIGTVVLNDSLMREYANQWGLIEQVREQRIAEMIHTGNIEIKRVEVRSPQMGLGI